MSAPRKRTNEEILTSLACTPSEAMRVLACRYATIVDLIETKRVHSFPEGKRTKIGVESLKAFARGGGPEVPAS